jgi:hypothetical protein
MFFFYKRTLKVRVSKGFFSVFSEREKKLKQYTQWHMLGFPTSMTSSINICIRKKSFGFVKNVWNPLVTVFDESFYTIWSHMICLCNGHAFPKIR